MSARDEHLRLVAATALLVSAVTLSAGHLAHPAGHSAAAVLRAQWAPAHALLLASFLFAVVGLASWVRVAGVASRLDLAVAVVAGVLVLVSHMLVIGQLYQSLFSDPWLAVHVPGALADLRESQTGLFLAIDLLLAAAYLAVGIVARAFVGGALLAVGGVAYALLPWLVPGAVLVGPIVLSAGLALAAIDLVRHGRERSTG